MKTFVDASGKTWNVALNLESAMRVKDLAEVDLLQPEAGEPPLITRIGTDEYLLAKVLLALLSDQFEQNGVTEAEVKRAFDGRTFADAQRAFYAELSDFFQSRGRGDRAKAVLKQAEILGLAVAAAERRVEQIDAAAKVDGAMSGLSPE